MKKEILDKWSEITEEEQALLDGSLAIDRDIYMQSEKNIINAQKLIDSGKLITIRPHTRLPSLLRQSRCLYNEYR